MLTGAGSSRARRRNTMKPHARSAIPCLSQMGDNTIVSCALYPSPLKHLNPHYLFIFGGRGGLMSRQLVDWASQPIVVARIRQPAR